MPSGHGLSVDDVKTAFGRAVRRFRATVELSQEGLAAASGLDRTYVSSLERGRRNPTLSTVFRLADALGVQPHVLVAATVEERRAHRDDTEGGA